MRERFAMLVMLASGCGGAPPPRAEEAPPPAPVLVASDPRLLEGVTLLAPVCAEGAEEACDAIDQDCDGAIDEGCEGASEAPLVAAVAWNGGADVELTLDLGTTDVSAAESLLGEARRSRAGCDGPRVERVELPELVAGAYRIGVAHRDACGSEGPVTVSLTYAVNGTTYGPFNRSLAQGESAELVELGVSACMSLDCTAGARGAASSARFDGIAALSAR